MHIVHVHIHIKPDQIEAFKGATIENARTSLTEPGIASFNIIQQADDPTRFILEEIYYSSDDPAKHRETLHFNKWRTIAEPMMAEPRTRTVYKKIFPSD